MYEIYEMVNNAEHEDVKRTLMVSCSFVSILV